jgi:Flp pilus assembly protein TadG
MSTRSKSRLERFCRSSYGGATIEAVLWMPIFVAILGLVADASIAFNRQALALRVVQDANRSMSVGRFTTEQQAEDFIVQRVRGFSPNATATTTVTAGIINSTVRLPAQDLRAIGLIPLLNGLALNVSAHHMAEL